MPVSLPLASGSLGRSHRSHQRRTASLRPAPIIPCPARTRRTEYCSVQLGRAPTTGHQALKKASGQQRRQRKSNVESHAGLRIWWPVSPARVGGWWWWCSPWTWNGCYDVRTYNTHCACNHHTVVLVVCTPYSILHTPYTSSRHWRPSQTDQTADCRRFADRRTQPAHISAPHFRLTRTSTRPARFLFLDSSNLCLRHPTVSAQLLVQVCQVASPCLAASRPQPRVGAILPPSTSLLPVASASPSPVVAIQKSYLLVRTGSDSFTHLCHHSSPDQNVVRQEASRYIHTC